MLERIISKTRVSRQLLDLADTSACKLQTEAARALALLDRLEQAILARAFRGELIPQDMHASEQTVEDPTILPGSKRIRRRSSRAA